VDIILSDTGLYSNTPSLHKSKSQARFQILILSAIRESGTSRLRMVHAHRTRHASAGIVRVRAPTPPSHTQANRRDAAWVSWPFLGNSKLVSKSGVGDSATTVTCVPK